MILQRKKTNRKLKLKEESEMHKVYLCKIYFEK